MKKIITLSSLLIVLSMTQNGTCAQQDSTITESENVVATNNVAKQEEQTQAQAQQPEQTPTQADKKDPKLSLILETLSETTTKASEKECTQKLLGLLIASWNDQEETKVSSDFLENLNTLKNSITKLDKVSQEKIQPLLDVDAAQQPLLVKNVFEQTLTEEQKKLLENTKEICRSISLNEKHFSSNQTWSFTVDQNCSEELLETFKKLDITLQNTVLASWIIDLWNIENLNYSINVSKTAFSSIKKIEKIFKKIEKETARIFADISDYCF